MIKQKKFIWRIKISEHYIILSIPDANDGK